MLEGVGLNIIHGLRDGIPIAMGYFAVAFSLGIIAAKAGLTPLEGFLTSFFTRASAGEYGTYTLIRNRFVRSFPVLCALRDAGCDDLSRYDSGYAHSVAGRHCPVGRHRCCMVPFGTSPCCSHLLCHRLFVDLKYSFFFKDVYKHLE